VRSALKGFNEDSGAEWLQVIGGLEELIEKTIEIRQRAPFGVG